VKINSESETEDEEESETVVDEPENDLSGITGAAVGGNQGIRNPWIIGIVVVIIALIIYIVVVYNLKKKKVEE